MGDREQMTPMNIVIPDKKGLVRSQGEDKFCQTNLHTYLQSKQTPEKLKNPEKSKNIEKPSDTNNAIDLNIKSSKKQLTQSTLTAFFQTTPS